MFCGAPQADLPTSRPPGSVTETAGEKLMVWAGLAAIGLQAATAWVALSLSLRLPAGKSL